MALGAVGIGLAVATTPTGAGLVLVVPSVIMGTTAFVEGSTKFIIGTIQDNKCSVPKSSFTWNTAYIVTHSKKAANFADNLTDSAMVWSSAKAAAVAESATELIWWLVDVVRSHSNTTIDLLRHADK